jgi:hypothetical protein
MKTYRHLVLGLTSAAAVSYLALGGAASAQFTSPEAALKKIRIPKEKPKPDQPAKASTSSVPASTSQGNFGAMHQAHMGEIVFTRTELDRDQMTESALANSFNLGDPIFFRVYMREPAVTLLQRRLPGQDPYWIARATRYKARFTVDGQTVDTTFRIWGKSVDHQSWTTWRGELLSRAEKFQPGTEVFREFLSRATQQGLMGTGTHKIKLEIIPFVFGIEDNSTASRQTAALGDIAASGEFTLTVASGSYSKTDPKICGHPAAQFNPALEQQILSRAKTVWTRPEATPAKVVLTHSNWNYTRHPVSGVILDRNIDAVIMSRGKDYCDFQGYNYIQPNSGGYSAANSSFVSEPHNWYLPCSCMD